MSFNYDRGVDGSLSIRITNEANEEVDIESFGYSDLSFDQCEVD